MSWEEGLVVVALSFECFEFAGDIDTSVGVVADVERNDAYGVSGDEEGVVVDIVEREGEDAAEPFDELGECVGVGSGFLPLSVECEDDLTVGLPVW